MKPAEDTLQAELGTALGELIPLAVAALERLQASGNPRVAAAAAAELAKARGLGLW